MSYIYLGVSNCDSGVFGGFGRFGVLPEDDAVLNIGRHCIAEGMYASIPRLNGRVRGIFSPTTNERTTSQGERDGLLCGGSQRMCLNEVN
jgi:hypothetical protein